MMIVVTGASASGKSAFAEQLLTKAEAENKFYIATMISWDEECERRIMRHRKLRAGKRFTTIERPLDLHRAVLPPDSAVLLECMSNLAANESYRVDRPDGQESVEEYYRTDVSNGQRGAEERILCGLEHLKRNTVHLIVVTNEVFCDGETYPEETRQYLELLGRLNQRLAGMADQVYEVVCGIPRCLCGD